MSYLKKWKEKQKKGPIMKMLEYEHLYQKKRKIEQQKKLIQKKTIYYEKSSIYEKIIFQL